MQKSLQIISKIFTYSWKIFLFSSGYLILVFTLIYWKILIDSNIFAQVNTIILLLAGLTLIVFILLLIIKIILKRIIYIQSLEKVENSNSLLKKTAIWLFFFGIILFLVNWILHLNISILIQDISVQPINSVAIGFFITAFYLCLIAILIKPAQPIENRKFWAKQIVWDLIIIQILATTFSIIISPKLFDALGVNDYLATSFDLSLSSIILTPQMLALTATAVQLSLGALVLIKYWFKSLPENLLQFKWKIRKSDIVLIACSLAAVFLFDYGYEFVLRVIGIQPPPQFQLSDNWRESFIWLLLSAGLGAPLAEELFFRGYMQPILSSKKWIWGIILTSLIFASFHLSLVYFIPLFVAGLIMGYAYYRSKNLLIPIIIHLCNNSLAVMIMYFSK